MSDHQRGPTDLEKVAIVIDTRDDVAIAKRMLEAGTSLRLSSGDHIEMCERVPADHKLALRDIASGETVRRYGQVIGSATQPIPAGAHIHTHNLAIRALELDFAFGADYRPVEHVPEAERRTFLGFRRRDGRVGTRNYVAVLASVNCSSSVTRQIADHFARGDMLRAFPNVDGVIGFATKGGCGADRGSPGMAMLQRTMAGIVDHPNVAAYLIVGLGCEVNQPDELIGFARLDRFERPPVLMIQQSGGSAKTIEAGIEAVGRLLPIADQARRDPVAASELVVALQCGGSDGWSGVTANPALGHAADGIVRQGGTVVLAETPEVYGAEHLLTRRARSREVGEKLLERIRWWERYTAMFGATIDANPTPGNKVGGLTTIYEKSLGAIAKAGSTPLNEVVEYAERITHKGLVHMDTPGYDPVSVTGQVAGGCNIVCFTTGRGSAFGFKPAPSIKIASDPAIHRSQEPDMDVDAGRILEGATSEEVGDEILERILAVASGDRTKSEAAGLGDEEFSPWLLGAVL
jgi:altronate hydrolase